MPLVTLVNPVAVSRPLAVAGQSPESTQRLSTSAPSEFDLGRFMECERGASAMWVKGVLSPERLPEPPATSDPGYRECCTVLSVLRARVAGAEVRIAGQLAQLWMSGGPPVSKSIAIVFGRPRVSLLIAVAALSMPKNPAIDEVPKAHGSIVLGKLLDSKGRQLRLRRAEGRVHRPRAGRHHRPDQGHAACAAGRGVGGGPADHDRGDGGREARAEVDAARRRHGRHGRDGFLTRSNRSGKEHPAAESRGIH